MKIKFSSTPVQKEYNPSEIDDVITDDTEALTIVQDIITDDIVELRDSVIYEIKLSIDQLDDVGIGTNPIIEEDLEYVVFDYKPVIVKELPNIEVVKDYITDNELYMLKDAGPVFKGPQGDKGTKGDTGPVGPDIYQTWLAQGNVGSFNDFLNNLNSSLPKNEYVFIQDIPMSKWIIKHNLNKHPTIILEDTAGDFFDADYRYLDNNTVEITIISPNAGKAYLN